MIGELPDTRGSNVPGVISPTIELLVVPDCAHEALARAALEDALQRLGLDTAAYQVVTIRTQDQAHERAFVGSPSFFINGRDLFPSTSGPAIACRVYSIAGRLAGTPGVDALVAALKDGLQASQRR